MPKDTAQQDALVRATAALADVDVAARCATLELGAVQDGICAFRLFGQDVTLHLDTLAVQRTDDGQPVKPADRLLVLHALACDLPLPADNTPLHFRDFPGGGFYEAPFRARTTAPLVRRYRGDPAALTEVLGRFDWEPWATGADAGGRVQAFGALSIVLLFWAADDEFDSRADVLFSPAVRRALCTEDAAVIASRICIGLL